MGLFGKKQTDDCEDLGEALAQTNSGRREVELVIGDDGELEAMTPDEAEKSGKEKVHSRQVPAGCLNRKVIVAKTVAFFHIDAAAGKV